MEPKPPDAPHPASRMLPILMTALVAQWDYFRSQYFSCSPDNEIESPMTVAILCDLVLSTVLNLLALPTLALRFGRFLTRTAWLNLTPANLALL